MCTGTGFGANTISHTMGTETGCGTNLPPIQSVQGRAFVTTQPLIQWVVRQVVGPTQPPTQWLT
jgi:hypothetical protein